MQVAKCYAIKTRGAISGQTRLWPILTTTCKLVRKTRWWINKNIVSISYLHCNVLVFFYSFFLRYNQSTSEYKLPRCSSTFLYLKRLIQLFLECSVPTFVVVLRRFCFSWWFCILTTTTGTCCSSVWLYYLSIFVSYFLHRISVTLAFLLICSFLVLYLNDKLSVENSTALGLLTLFIEWTLISIPYAAMDAIHFWT